VEFRKAAKRRRTAYCNVDYYNNEHARLQSADARNNPFKQNRRGSGARAALLATSALLAGMPMAHANDSTWIGGSNANAYTDNANWTNGTPSGMATFGPSPNTSVNFPASSLVQAWTFAPGASNYTFTMSDTFSFLGTGITINGGSATLNNFNALAFENASSAGSSTINNHASLVFADISTAGNAAITNSAGGITDFSQSSGPNNDHKLSAGSIAGAGMFSLGQNQLNVGGNNTSTTVSGVIADGGLGGGTGGSLVKTGTGTLTLSGSNTYTGGTVFNAGIVSFSRDDNLGAATGPLIFNGGTLSFANNGSQFLSATRAIALNGDGGTIDIANGGSFNALNVSSTIAGAGGLTKTGPGLLVLAGTNNYGGSTNIVAGELDVGNSHAIPSTSAVTIASGAALGLGGNQTIGSLAGGGSVFSPVAGGQVVLTTGADNTSTVFSGVISNGNALNLSVWLTKVGTGTLTLTGNNTYTGATTVNGGVLQVDGLTFSSSVTVNSGGTLAGSGKVGPTTIASGGVLMPGTNTAGSSLTVQGNLAFQSGAQYVVQLNPTTSSFTNVAGTATLGGATVNAIYAPGSYISKQYTILNAGDNINGTFNSTVVNTNLPKGFTSSLSYDPTHVILNLTLNLNPAPDFGGGLNHNQQHVANALINFFNTNGGIPGAFGALTPQGLTQASGEGASSSQQTASIAMNQFMNVMTDPSVGGRGGDGGFGVDDGNNSGFGGNGGNAGFYDGKGGNGGDGGFFNGNGGNGGNGGFYNGKGGNGGLGGSGGNGGSGRSSDVGGTSSASGYASETCDAPDALHAHREREAYAAMSRKAPVAETFAQRWSVWAMGYGGSQTTDGNAVLGTNTATSRIYGTAVGADYWFSPYTVAGFALGGGGTNFSVANGLGGGRSDLFQAGAFVRHNIGRAYVSAALAYGWQDVTTDRTVTVSGIDQLRARFNANSFSGRVEGGYRFVAPAMGGIGLTPYAAGQFTTFDLPAYAESAVVGANTFALSYGAKSVTAPRSELGLRGDKSYPSNNGILTLRGRVAWAYDFNPNQSVAATFQTLPGASFVVNGAAGAHNVALTTASAEMKWRSGWSAGATFEGEFSEVTRSYAGKGIVRYAW
jgi:autotransporter-associated beta strand protein